MAARCEKTDCKYNNTNWCSKPIVTLTCYGLCSEWYREDGRNKNFQEYLKYEMQKYEEQENE